jgi:putative addiction module CopG family antidote
MPTTLTISLSDELRDIVEQQVAAGAYASRDEYIRALIRRDQQLAARKRLEAELVERADQSDSVLMDRADVAQMREELKRRLGLSEGSR